MTAPSSSPDFQAALDFVLRHEGGFVDHPEDPGGATNFGITLGTYRQWARRNGQAEPDVEDLKAISSGQVAEIYYHDYWRACHAPDLPLHLAFGVFDMGVNAGPARAIRLLQQTLGVTVDGVVGPQTLTAVKDRQSDPVCLDDYTARRLNYYGRLSTFSTFGLGWARRAVACHREAEARAPWRSSEQSSQEPTSSPSTSLWSRLWKSLI